MKTVRCASCRRELCTDEVALNQRLLGMQVGAFYCTDCLAPKLHTTPSHLKTLITRFKEMGCAYFTRLMEETSDERNDSL